jgi:tRNA 2-thiouridine synthesizing protein A
MSRPLQDFRLNEDSGMTEKRIDARGLSCPQPVVLTKRELDKMEAGLLEVLVDNMAAVENVSRLAEKSGCTVRKEEDGDDFIVMISKTTDAAS